MALRRVPPRRIVTFAAGVMLLFLARCGDDDLVKLEPRIEVDPEMMDFGVGIVDADNVLTLRILNRGGGPLEIGAIEIVAGAPVFSLGEGPKVVRALGEAPQKVVFIPAAAHEVYQGTLRIRSNDPARPEVMVPLIGVGGVREIEVFPEEIDFGIVNEGAAPRRTIEIKNTGGDPLVISAVTFTSTSVDLALVPGTFARGSIAPRTSTVVELVYSPLDLGADTATVTINSNDEDEPVVQVHVRGRANLAPRAIAWGCTKLPSGIGCDGRPTSRELLAEFQRIIGLDGRESHDPEGDALTFQWRVVTRPARSNQTVFHTNDDRNLRKRATGEITVDAVGLFDLRLVATDERGLESLDVPESHVLVVPSDLEVVARRDISADIDLHFVRPGGMLGDYGSGVASTSTGSDCTTFNRSPNWGDPGSSEDDPRYQIDSVSGVQPEIVSINAPEESGPYAVHVHYCGQSGQAPANITVDIYVRGTLIGTVPAAGSYRLGPGEVWEAARVTWDGSSESASFEDRSAEQPVSRPGLCLIE